MLLAMRLAVWLAVMISVAMAAGFADYLLRLPGWLRLAGSLAMGIGGLYELFVQIHSAIRVKPALTSLALRLERLYPQARGRVASAVAFASSPAAASALESAMAQRAEAESDGVLDARQVGQLIDPKPMMRKFAMLALALAALAGIAAASPDSVRIALARWTQPLGDAKWPNRYTVASAIKQTVAPNNAPLAVDAQVTKGEWSGLRTWVVYQFLKADGTAIGEPLKALMTRQPGSKGIGDYQRLIEPIGGADRVVLHFEAGDDQTGDQSIKLITPPTLRQLIAQIDPPDYAAQSIQTQRYDLLTPPRPSVVLDALEGSRLRLLVQVDGSFHLLDTSGMALTPATEARMDWVYSLLMGITDGPDKSSIEPLNESYTPTFDGKKIPGGFELSWVLRRSVQFHFNLADEYGSTHEDQRQFRIETRADRPPRATILQPAADESVLPTAVADLAAEAQDDVAVAELKLEARRAKAAPMDLGAEKTPAARSHLNATLDLAMLQAKPGDEISIVGIVRDNYLLDGRRHEPVESTARILRVISAEEMSRQVRTELAELRQRALRAQASQQRLIESPAVKATAAAQQELTEQIGSMTKSVQSIQQRARRNKLDDPALTQTLEETAKLTADAGKASEQAGEKLARAARDPQNANPQTKQDAQQGRSAQQQSKAELDKLVQLLDQGRDAYELQQKLVKLARDQDQTAGETRQMMSKTLGKELDQLDPKDKNALQQMARKQDDLAQLARQISDRMRSTAAAISRQSERPEDQAMAEAMRQAADTAVSEALDQKMQDASRQAGQNRLSQAQSLQQQAQEVLKKMLDQMGKTEKIRQEILQRKLAELVDGIRKLLEQQKAQLERLAAAEKLAGLDEPQIALRRNTLGVAEQARSTGKEAEPVAALLEDAGAAQSDAAVALRTTGSKTDAQLAENVAVKKLAEALKLAEELARKAQNDEAEKKMKELVEGYNKTLAEQKAIRQGTAQLAGSAEDQRDRKWRADAVGLGNRQADLRVALTKLKEKLDETIVYQSVHDQIDAWTGAASASLRRMSPDARVLFNQDLTVGGIEALLEALKPNKPEEEFAQSGGGEGGGQSGGNPPLIPPVAELKLLRGRQLQVHTMTRALDQPASGNGGLKLDAEQRSAILQELAKQQEDLAAVGIQMLQALKQPRQQMMPLPLDDTKPEESEKKP